MSTRNILILALLLAAVGVGATFLLGGRSTSDSPDVGSASVGTKEAPHSSGSTSLTAPDPSGAPAKDKDNVAVAVNKDARQDLSPEAEFIDPLQAKVEALITEGEPKGLLSMIAPVTGGESAVDAHHRTASAPMRAARVHLLETVFAQYSGGEPGDPTEFQQYEDAKVELNWLRAHPKP